MEQPWAARTRSDGNGERVRRSNEDGVQDAGSEFRERLPNRHAGFESLGRGCETSHGLVGNSAQRAKVRPR